MFPSWLQILLVVLLVVLLFGRGRISDLMGDVAKGIKSFRSGLSDDEEEQKKAPEALEQSSEKPTAVLNAEDKEKAKS